MEAPKDEDQMPIDPAEREAYMAAVEMSLKGEVEARINEVAEAEK